MKHQPFTEYQTMDRLWYFASNEVAAHSDFVANVCYHLSRGFDDTAVLARWTEILTQFAGLFRAAYPEGLRIRATQQTHDIDNYQPALADALRMWNEAKSIVLGISPSQWGSITSSQPEPRTTPRLLTGGSAGEPIETDGEPIGTVQHTSTESVQPQHSTTSPTFFHEVTVRRAKVTQQDSTQSSIIDTLQLEAAERETVEVDLLLAAMLGADNSSPQANDDKTQSQ